MPIDRQVGVVPVIGQVAHTRNAGEMKRAAIIVLRLAAFGRDFRADVGRLELDVDDTGNGIGAVQRRSSVLEDFDPIDGIEWDRRRRRRSCARHRH